MFEWKLFTPYTYTLWPTRQLPDLAKRLEVATNGALKLKIYIAGEHPFKHADMLKVVKDRDAETSEVLGGYVAGVEPAYAALDLPMFTPGDASQTMALFRATKAQIFDPVADKWGAMELATYFWPHQRLHTKKPAVTANSLAGAKIRTWTLDLNPWVGLLGGIPVSVAWAEVPTALATGVVDGGVTNSGAAYDAGWYDYTRYMNLWEIQFGVASIMVNKAAWAELGPALQKTVQAVFDEWEAYVIPGAILDADAKVLLAAKDFGATVIAPSKAFRTEIRDKSKVAVWDAWKARAGAAGAAAHALIEAKIVELGFAK